MRLTEEELAAVAKDAGAPYFERKLAVAISNGQWEHIERMINQVYGMPKQSIEQTNLEPPQPLSPRKSKKAE